MSSPSQPSTKKGSGFSGVELLPGAGLEALMAGFTLLLAKSPCAQAHVGFLYDIKYLACACSAGGGCDACVDDCACSAASIRFSARCTAFRAVCTASLACV